MRPGLVRMPRTASILPRFESPFSFLRCRFGKRGIRTPETLTGLTVFETARFDRSRIFPGQISQKTYLVRRGGFEPPTFGSAGQHSIQLSHSLKNFQPQRPFRCRNSRSDLAEATGVEPARPVRNRRFSKPLYYRSTTPPKTLLGSEREGFEPPIPKRYNGFQDRRVRPLCHRSN